MVVARYLVKSVKLVLIMKVKSTMKNKTVNIYFNSETFLKISFIEYSIFNVITK